MAINNNNKKLSEKTHFLKNFSSAVLKTFSHTISNKMIKTMQKDKQGMLLSSLREEAGKIAMN